MKKKRFSIRTTITTPFIGLTIIFPFVTLVSFNLFIAEYDKNRYEDNMDKSLIEISSSINSLIEGQYSLISPQNSMMSIDFLESNLYLLRNTSIFSNDVHALLFSQDKALIYPYNFDNSFLTSKIVSTVQLYLFTDFSEFEVIRFEVDSRKYSLVIYQPQYITSSPYLIYVSRLENTPTISNTANTVIFSIIIVGLVVNVTLALLLSQQISKPIQHLSKYASSLGNNFSVIEEAHESSLELFQLHNILNESALQRKEYDNRQRKFLQNISHELRTPLMSIQGYSESILKDILPDNKMAAQIICDESNRLTKLIGQIITLSKVESNMFVPTFNTINLPDMIKDCLQRLEGFAIKESKCILLDIPHTYINVTIDDELFSNVITNVVSNCIRFAQKEVQIRIQSIGNNATIIVDDDGPGIQPKDLPHVFERFYKGSNGTSGLGLAIAKSSVQTMGGKITCTNMTSGGARFIITLPLADQNTHSITLKNLKHHSKGHQTTYWHKQ